MIALKDYIVPQSKPSFTRFNVFLRDKFSCQYCGSNDELTFDQIAAVVMKVFASGAGENIQTLEVMDLKAVQALAGGVSYTPPGG